MTTPPPTNPPTDPPTDPPTPHHHSPESNGSYELPDNPIKILQLINSGEIEGKSVPKPVRVLCVKVLLLKGHTVYEIAAIFGVTDRTIRRDKQEIWLASSAERTEEFEKMMTGLIIENFDQIMSDLRKIVADRRVQDAVRQMAVRDQWIITEGFIRCLQKLGYLPEAPRQINASFTAEPAEPGSLDELAAELESLESVANDAPAGNGTSHALQIATRSLASAALQEAKQPEPKDETDEDHDGEVEE